MWTTLTDKVRKAFSDAADQYDILTTLHKEIGRELVKKTVRLEANRILDVGCGTGYVANKAKFFFPESLIVGLDLAEGMLQKAAQLHEGIPITWLHADAQNLPFKDQSFDLIFSNLSYQWTDINISFKQARRVLSSNGFFYATLFGGRTCEELIAALLQCAPQHSTTLLKLPTVEQTQQALAAAGFKDIDVDYELIKVQFKDVMELLNWMKAIGANNLAQDVFLGKQMLAQVNEYYRKQYPYKDGICASFEVIWFNAQAEK